MTESWDDDELLAALGRALSARETMPREFVEAGQAVFAWRDIDTELARLTYDSAQDAEPSPALRAGPEAASIRALTFASAHLTIELEVTPGSLVGQVIPVQAATIEVQLQGAPPAEFPADEIGLFSIQPVPSGPFRLHCRPEAGPGAVTGWVTL